MRLLIKSWFLVIFSVASHNASALDLDIRSHRSNVLDFSLLIENSTVDLQEDATDIELNLDRIGILSIDVPSSGPHFGIALGYAFSDIISNDVYQSISMDGYYIGISVRAYLFELKNLSLLVSGQYLYQDVYGREDLQEGSLDWNEFSVSGIVTLRLSNALRLFAGPVWGTIDATYRVEGDNRFTEKFDNKNANGYLAGVGYRLNKLESLSVHYQQAHTEGVILRFRRLF